MCQYGFVLNKYLLQNTGTIPEWWWLQHASASCAALSVDEAYACAIDDGSPRTCLDFGRGSVGLSL